MLSSTIVTSTGASHSVERFEWRRFAINQQKTVSISTMPMKVVHWLLDASFLWKLARNNYHCG